MAKKVYIHFVDERDFKEVSLVAKRKSKKNRAVEFVLTAVSAERTNVVGMLYSLVSVWYVFRC